MKGVNKIVDHMGVEIKMTEKSKVKLSVYVDRELLEAALTQYLVLPEDHKFDYDSDGQLHTITWEEHRGMNKVVYNKPLTGIQLCPRPLIETDGTKSRPIVYESNFDDPESVGNYRG